MSNCKHQVPCKGMNFLRFRECKNNAVVFVNGKGYCNLHNPNKQDEREKQKEEKRKQRNKYKQTLFRFGLKKKNK